MQRNIVLINAYSMCLSAIFVLPVLVPYYADVIGLGFREFLIGEAMFSAVVLFMEVPSGWLSDIWRRKNVLALSTLFGMAGYATLLIADSLIDILIAQGLIGIGLALHSGTGTALLYDTLAAHDAGDSYRRREGARQGLAMGATAVAAVGGGLLYSINVYAPLIVDIAALGLAFVCCLFMQEPPRIKQRGEHSIIDDMLATMRYCLRGHKQIAALIFFCAMLFTTTKLLMWAQQPYYMALDIHEGWFGVLMACGLGLGAVSAHFGHRLEAFIRPRTILISLWALCIAAASIAGTCPGMAAIPLLFIGSLAFGLGNPVMHDALNNRVGSERRATVISTASLMIHIGFIPLSIIFGMVSDDLHITIALLGLAGFMAVTGGGLLSYWLYHEPRVPAAYGAGAPGED
jgi:MFS family permease